ncbi:hypothetical protein [Stygiolobus caldivivus]|uniref:Uncharacterized protein n=1 Tax=Stygiolobus caldivivus TaxID=2824673 RepID=A0A8D5ZKD2_9CREN|nr:hypothetical protein [Stygiolobus caldivivus]BCU71265.1 hypothetical protein KN1_25620 [Stygiolobus caldivivus]
MVVKLVSVRRILLTTSFAIVAIFSIVGYNYSLHSHSNSQLPYIFLVQAVVGTVGLIESIITIPYKDHTEDSYFKQKWRDFILLSTPVILVYVIAGIIVAIFFKSITTLLEISLLYGIVISILYIKKVIFHSRDV